MTDKETRTALALIDQFGLKLAGVDLASMSRMDDATQRAVAKNLLTSLMSESRSLRSKLMSMDGFRKYFIEDDESMSALKVEKIAGILELANLKAALHVIKSSNDFKAHSETI